MAGIYFEATHPKARKPHSCLLCGRTIGAGEAWSAGECACGNYPSEANPYRKAGR